MHRAALCIALAGAGCGWSDHQFDRVDDAAVTDATPDGRTDVDLDSGFPVDDAAGLPDPTNCPPSPTTAGFCAALADFAGAFVNDGAGDEFCRASDAGAQMPPRRFTVTEAARTAPSPPPAGFAERFEVRAGLDAYGVHVFVQVLGDPRVLVDRDDPVQGDAVELFLRGTVTRELTGNLESDEGNHLVLTPPSATAGGVGWRYLGGVKKLPLSDSDWHSRRVKGGWEVEVHYPWTELKNQPAPGMVMGFDVAIDLKDDPAKKGRDVRALMHVTPVASSASCTALGVSPADPLCDDRTWCLAKAYVP